MRYEIRLKVQTDFDGIHANEITTEVLYSSAPDFFNFGDMSGAEMIRLPFVKR